MTSLGKTLRLREMNRGRAPIALAATIALALAAVIAVRGLRSVAAQTSRSQAEAPAPTASESEASARLAPIRLTPERRQLIGVRFATVEEQEITGVLDATGTISPDEQLESYVQTRFAGWIRTVFADHTYAFVKKGEPLFTIYSPDLANAEQEYLVARNQQVQVANSRVPDVREGAASIAQAALTRLSLFGVSPREIERLKRENTARDTVEIDSPATGYITERNAIPNMYAQPETKLYTIANLSRVWVYAAVFQNELGAIKDGDGASVAVDAYPGRTFTGRIDFIWPEVDSTTRTASVRCDFDNPGGILKPGMFVRVSLKTRLGRGLVIPDSGVLRTGTHNVTFVDRGDGYLQPVEIELGHHLDHSFQVLKGLRAGQRIVTSANFLIDSESQLQAALGGFAPPPPGAGGAAAAGATASMDVTTDPSPPHKGRNTVRIALRDSFGRPIEGADLTVVFFMPAMPAMGMAAMRREANATDQGKGNYVATIELESGGTWQMTVVASKSGKEVANRQMSESVTGPMM